MHSRFWKREGGRDFGGAGGMACWKNNGSSLLLGGLESGAQEDLRKGKSRIGLSRVFLFFSPPGRTRSIPPYYYKIPPSLYFFVPIFPSTV